MKVVLDTNVILDIWLGREPFWRDSAELLGLVENGKMAGILCPTTITTLHYLARKVLGDKKARALIEELLRICQVGGLTSEVFREALKSEIKDFEDGVIEAIALDCGADCIATRNVKDFKKSRIPAREPARLLP